MFGEVLPTISIPQCLNRWNLTKDGIWLDTLTTEAVYNALLNGNFYASTGVVITNYQVTDNGTYKIITVSSSNATRIKFWGPGHEVLQESNSNTATYVLHNKSYVRVKLINEGF